ncbi:MAG: HDOD domain-containing protein [Thermodesulfobacteria bacterium]|nr:HDOD domain-containing protein [Thermodesulfobacteriota bacterium]
MKAEILRLISRLKRIANFPVLKESIQALRHFRTETEATPERLIRIVLLDPGLCCQILRAGNSVFYNPSGYPLKTISRAVVIIGFQNLKILAESSPTVPAETLERGNFSREMATSILSAHLAAKAARKKGIPQEEAYLASLFKRLGRLILLLYDPSCYQKIRAQVPRRKKELFYLVGERLAKQWNLPENIVNNLEGRELYIRPRKLGHLCLYADIMAAGLISGKGPVGWQNIFENPREIEEVLKQLVSTAKHLPASILESLAIKLPEARAEDESLTLGPFLPEEALKLAQKVLQTLCEEISARGRLFYREGERLFTLEGEIGEEEDLRKFLLQGEITTRDGQVYIPVNFRGNPALILHLERESALPPEELRGLELVKRTLESLLERL